MGNPTETDSRALAAELSQVLAHNALLQVAARHDDLLRREAFEELAATLARFVPLGSLSVVVPDGEEQILYAASMEGSAAPAPPFGARFPLPALENQSIVMQGGVRICRDTRAGDALDRSIARFGYLSYAALPIRDLESREVPAPIVAKLIVCFKQVDEVAQAPVALLEAAAELFGSRFASALARARDRRLAMILDTSGDAMLAWDHAGKITDANAAASRLTGTPRSDLMGRPIDELVEGLTEGEPTRSFRTHLRAPGASSTPISVTITQVRDDPVVAAHLLARDISHVVAAEREAAAHMARIRALEQQHRTLLDNVPLVIFRLHPVSGDLLYINRYAGVLLGISQEHARAHPSCLRAAHAGAAAAQSFQAALRGAQVGGSLEAYEARLIRPGGAELAVRATLYALTEGSEVVAVEGILADVSAEYAARTQLVQTDRLSTLGRLAASIAHEINNPAAFLMLGLEHLSRTLSAQHAGDSAERAATLALLGQLTESLQRIAAIVRDLRYFAGPLKTQSGASAVPTDVGRAVQSALTLTRSQLIERARLVIDLEPVPPALIEEGRLAQVIVNLLVNAAQAIPKDSGREHRIRVSTRLAGDEVQIEVSDDGMGIAPADLTRIWAPFFTTKELGTGTGLGLAISRDIVERAGGRIEVVSPAVEDSVAGRVGSRFIVCLRAATDAARPSSAKEPAPTGHLRPSAIAPRRILIVDDEFAFGRALSRELGAWHHVVLAESGARALALLRGERFDVILCELRMPELSGEAVYLGACDICSEHRPAFIFMTGLGEGAELARLHELYRCPVLEKPFSLERLLQTIAEVPVGERDSATARPTQSG